MQRQDADGSFFCHRSYGRAQPERSREGLLVRREQQCKAEREGLHECVAAVNAELQELEKKREELEEKEARLCQVRHLRHICCDVTRRLLPLLTCPMLLQMAELVESRRDSLREFRAELKLRERALTQVRHFALPSSASSPSPQPQPWRCESFSPRSPGDVNPPHTGTQHT